jgi:hypothetical protein
MLFESKKKILFSVLNIIYFVSVTSINNIYYAKISAVIGQNYFLILLRSLARCYACFLFFSLLFFKIKYSPFSPIKRASFPKDGILEEYRVDGWIGIFYGLIKCKIFKQGLGLKILFFIKIYIPIEQIQIISKKKIIHKSPEIYNPIILNEKVINRLNELIQQQTSSYCKSFSL